MKKIFIILAILLFTCSSAWAIEKPCKKPCDIENANSLTVEGKAAIGTTIQPNAQLYVDFDLDGGGNVLELNGDFNDVGLTGTAQSKGIRNRVNFFGSGTLDKYTALTNSMVFNTTGNYNFDTHMSGISNVLSLSGSGSHTIPEHIGIAVAASGGGTETFNGGTWHLFHIGDYATEAANATFATDSHVGLFIKKQTGAAVASNNHGIWLAGNDDGSDINFGLAGDASLVWSTVPTAPKMHLNNRLIVGLGADVADMSGDFNVVGGATTVLLLRDSTNDTVAQFSVMSNAVRIGSESAIPLQIMYEGGIHTRYGADGHIGTGGLGVDPAITSCGTSPTTVSGSTDNAGIVNVGGGGAVTACTVTFNTAYTAEPAIQITTQHNSTAYLSASSNTAFTVTFSADAQSQQFSYHVVGLNE